MAAAATVIGMGSIILFFVFLWRGSFGLVPLGMGHRSALAWDGLLCLVFFLQHSGMVRRPFRDWLGGIVQASYHGAVYAIASGAALLLLVALWQPVPAGLTLVAAFPRLAVRGIYVAALAAQGWGVRALPDFDPFGLRPLLSSPEAQQAMPLAVRGPYRWVRHPLYSLMIVAIWACPDLSADRLLFDVLWTIWIVAGARLEERDLVAAFGNAYRAYQGEVPMLVPCRRPKR